MSDRLYRMLLRFELTYWSGIPPAPTLYMQEAGLTDEQTRRALDESSRQLNIAELSFINLSERRLSRLFEARARRLARDGRLEWPGPLRLPNRTLYLPWFRKQLDQICSQCTVNPNEANRFGLTNLRLTVLRTKRRSLIRTYLAIYLQTQIRHGSIPDLADYLAVGQQLRGQLTEKEVKEAVCSVGQEMMGYANWRFERREILDSGGQADVFIGTDHEVARDVAIKMLSPRSGDEDRAILKKEAIITASLNHPSIPSVFAIGMPGVGGVTGADRGNAFFAMEYVNGPPLDLMIRVFHGRQRPEDNKHFEKHKSQQTLLDLYAKKIRRGAVRTNTEFMTLIQHIIDVCWTLEHAHSSKVIHRDVKPSNILIGNQGQTYVIDWGMARVNREDLPPARRKGIGTSSNTLRPDPNEMPSVVLMLGTLVGTPEYMAPEQAAFLPGTTSSPQVSDRSDVYGVGAVLYHLISGRIPLEDISADRMVQVIHQAASQFKDEDQQNELKRLTQKTAGELRQEFQKLASGTQDTDAQANIANAMKVFLVANSAALGLPKPPRPSRYFLWRRPKVDRELQRICCRAMSANPAGRYSAKELAERLEAWRNDVDHSEFRTFFSYFRRHPAIPATVLFASLLTIVGLWFTFQYWKYAASQQNLKDAEVYVDQLSRAVLEKQVYNSAESSNTDLIEITTGYFEVLSKSKNLTASSRAKFQLQHAEALEKVGKFDEALSKCKEALTQLEKPTSHHEALAKSRLLHRQSVILTHQHKLATAKESLQSCLNIVSSISTTGQGSQWWKFNWLSNQQSHVSSDISPSELQTEKAKIYGYLGDVQLDLGEIEEAGESYQSSLMVRQEVVTNDRHRDIDAVERANHYLQLARGYENIARRLIYYGKHSEKPSAAKSSAQTAYQNEIYDLLEKAATELKSALSLSDPGSDRPISKSDRREHLLDLVRIRRLQANVLLLYRFLGKEAVQAAPRQISIHLEEAQADVEAVLKDYANSVSACELNARVAMDQLLSKLIIGSTEKGSISLDNAFGRLDPTDPVAKRIRWERILLLASKDMGVFAGKKGALRQSTESELTVTLAERLKDIGALTTHEMVLALQSCVLLYQANIDTTLQSHYKDQYDIVWSRSQLARSSLYGLYLQELKVRLEK